MSAARLAGPPAGRVRQRGIAARPLIALALVLSCLTATDARAQKKEAKSATPTILCASALTLLPNTTKTLKLRGLQLADATAVKAESAGVPVPATLKSKGKSEVPKPFEAPKLGDTEAQVELKLPADLKPGDLAITLTTPAGPTPAFTIRVADPAAIVEEKEPNNGFKNAQELPMNKTVLATIENVGDVDVFKFGGRAGTRVVIEVSAQRRGSPMDGAITVYDAAGHVLANADDPKDGATRDPVLRFTLLSDGAYYVSACDANDRASAVHAYELTVREEK